MALLDTRLLGIALGVFLIVMFAIGFWAQRRISNAEDYLVAGRKLPFSLACATLFATWFGAGTLLTATDEVRAEGLRAAALEPIGPGLCLVVAGLFFARRLWDMKLLTLPDFYRRRFGTRAEVIASLIMIPGYFGWIAAQFVALAGVLQLFWGVPLAHGIWLVAFVGTGYTLLGGMWSVTLTDAVQLAILLLGLLVVGFGILLELGGVDGAAAGWLRFVAETPPEKLVLIPNEDAAELLSWLSVLAIGILGNLPGQDLSQRIFAARSANVAIAACLVAGVFYVVLGFVPVLSGLAADLLAIDSGENGTLPLLAATVLSPGFGILFVLALTSAVMSTIDSAILAPASVLSNNLMTRVWERRSPLALSRAAVVFIAGISLAMSYLGQDAYELLETAYAVGMVGLFVPLALGLLSRRGGERAAIASMVTGIAIWGVHLALGLESFGGPLLGSIYLPQELGATAIAWLVYEIIGRLDAR